MKTQDKGKVMHLSDILSLLGGLALFLYGMNMMSNGLEMAAGDRMKSILEKLTANRVVGVLVGALITAVIQSSSATTVMVVGFVNSGLMTLTQAVWIIMGANIGTTITGQLIALDVGAIAPLVAFIGVVFVTFVHNPKLNSIGQILAGFGVLFIGMNTMGDAMAPLKDVPEFVNMMTSFSNPLIGILVGALFTALIQSSSASVGILQTLASSGLIALDGAVFVLFGQNIGTCITAVLASIGTNREAKQTTIIHLSFNIIGTVIFTILCLTTPLVSFVESWTPTRVSAQIANMHTLFNVVTTLILLPVGQYLVKFAQHILPVQQKDIDLAKKLVYINPVHEDKNIGTSMIYLKQTINEIKRMGKLVQENIADSFDQMIQFDSKKSELINQREELLDYLTTEISGFISNALTSSVNQMEATRFQNLYTIVINLERIGDHAINFNEYGETLSHHKIPLPKVNQEEIYTMKVTCLDILTLVENPEQTDYESVRAMVKEKEQEIDDLTIKYRDNQLQRMEEGGIGSGEISLVYSQMLTDYERIGDHALNISKYTKEMFFN